MARQPDPDYRKVFAANLDAIRRDRGYGPTEWTAFAAELQTTDVNARRWCLGTHAPRIDEAARIAVRLGVSLDELTGRRNPRQAAAAAAEAVPAQLASIETMLQAVLARLDAAREEWGAPSGEHGARAALVLASAPPKPAPAGRSGIRRRSRRAPRSDT